MNSLENIQKFIEDNTGKHPCCCGLCSEFVDVKPQHYYCGIPFFRQGHASKVRNPMSGKTCLRKGIEQKILKTGTIAELYILHKLSIRQISEMMICSPATIRSRIIKAGIGIRTRQETERLRVEDALRCCGA